MIVQPVSKPLFHFAGKTEQQISPHVTKQGDCQGNRHDRHAVFEKNTGSCGFKGEGVDGLSYNLGDQYLK